MPSPVNPPDVRRSQRDATRLALVAAVLVSLLAVIAAGPAALGATLAGAAVGLGFGRSLASGLAALVEDPAGAKRARQWALLGAFIRYPLMGGALAIAVMLFELPVGWLAAGVTTWPLGLLIATARAAMANFQEA